MTIKEAVKAKIKQAAVSIIYRYPPTGLQPERLGIYLNALTERVHLSGNVAEIGCNIGGTSILGYKAMTSVGEEIGGWKGKYICYDTFGGFVPEQFDADAKKGTRSKDWNMFSANSLALTRKILNYHKCHSIELVQGDITTLPNERLSNEYSVVLLDIDLSEPTYIALTRFYPRVVAGGIILVDDCPPNYNWKAREGYKKFVTEMGLPEVYKNGLGIIIKN